MWRSVLICMVMSILASCAVFAPSVKMRTLVLDVAPQANDDTPIAVDFVVVNDGQVLQNLLTTPSGTWFAQRDQLQRDYPATLKVWSHEVVPGQKISFDSVPIAGDKALALLVFADYRGAGSHRLRVDGARDVVIRLDSKDLHLRSGS